MYIYVAMRVNSPEIVRKLKSVVERTGWASDRVITFVLDNALSALTEDVIVDAIRERVEAEHANCPFCRDEKVL